MTGKTFLGRWLIDLATTNPPSGREEWARAMRAEFETLESGHAGWALGCLGASLGWRLTVSWASLLVIAAIVIVPHYLDRVVGWPLADWLHSSLLHSRLSFDTYRALSYATNWGVLAAVAGILAAVRPRLWIVIGLGTALAHTLDGFIRFMVAFDKPISVIPHLNIMDAQLEVGIGAYLGYSLVGALIGRSLGDGLRRAAPGSAVKPS